MNTTHLIVAFTLVVTPGFFVQESANQKEAEWAGYVFEVKGKCYLRDDERSQRRNLTPKNANGTKLRTGQELLCDAGGSLKFKFYKSGADMEVTSQAPPVWYKIPNVPARSLKGDTDSSGGSRPGGRIAEYRDIPSMREASQAEESTDAAVERFAETAGAAAAGEKFSDKSDLRGGAAGRSAATGAAGGGVASTGGGSSGGGASSAASSPPRSRTDDNAGRVGEKVAAAAASPRVYLSISSPAWSGGFFLENLVFRWKLMHAGGAAPLLSLKLEDFKGGVIWKQDGVAATARELISEEARAAVRQFREKNPDALLKFSVSHEGRELDYVYFKPLPAEAEKTLREELSELDKREEFLRLIGRADAFARRGLYAESAQEYEQALRASPENEDLQIAVVFALCRAGNWDRALEIRMEFKIPYSAWDNACTRGRSSRP